MLKVLELKKKPETCKTFKIPETLNYHEGNLSKSKTNEDKKL